MTYVGNPDHENNGRTETGDDDAPDGPYEATARVGNTQKSYSDTTFDSNGT
jgi:hypothetical protein